MTMQAIVPNPRLWRAAAWELVCWECKLAPTLPWWGGVTCEHCGKPWVACCRQYNPVPWKPQEAVQLARLAMKEITPLLGSLRCHVIEQDTMSVSYDQRLWVGRELLKGERWNSRQAAGVVLHECFHLMERHNARAIHHGIRPAPGSKEPGFWKQALLNRAWNHGCDAHINELLWQYLVGNRYAELPPDGIYPESLGADPHLSSEAYFIIAAEHLEQRQQERAQEIQQELQQQQDLSNAVQSLDEDGTPNMSSGEPCEGGEDGEPQPGEDGEPQPGEGDSSAGECDDNSPGPNSDSSNPPENGEGEGGEGEGGEGEGGEGGGDESESGSGCGDPSGDGAGGEDGEDGEGSVGPEGPGSSATGADAEEGDSEGESLEEQAARLAGEEMTADAEVGGSCADGIRRDYETPEEAGPDRTDTPSIEQTLQSSLDGIAMLARNQLAKSSRGEAGELCKLANIKPPEQTKITGMHKLRNLLRKSGCRTSHGMDSRTYSRTSRYSSDRQPMPVARGRTPKITLVIDTSWSMSVHNRLSLAVGAITAVRAMFRDQSGITVLTGDTECKAQAVNVRFAEEILDDLVGGGGTDMAKIMLQAAQEKPELLIVATDCETPWPAQADMKGIPTVVCATEASERRIERIPSYMEVVTINNQDHEE
jgi:Mg-chelatase subunit ChlD